MKRIIAIVLFSSTVGFAKAQVIPNSNTAPASVSGINPVPAAYDATIKVNLIRVWNATKPLATDTSVTSVIRTLQEVKQVTQYFDGLGRPLQTVSKQISASGKDVIAPVIYDELGREMYKYLPYVSIDSNTNNGKFKRNPFNEQASFLGNATYSPDLTGEQVYYSKTVFETSPLNRADTSFAPGNSWGGSHVGVVNSNQINTAADSVRLWTIGFGVGSSPSTTAYYGVGQLYKNVIKDERGKLSIEYKDKQGKLILKKVQLDNSPSTHHTGWLCSYYIYDQLDRLRYLIQPKGVEAKTPGWVLSQTVLDELCFRYDYDARGRIIIKKVPAAGEVWMVYDARDRLVMSQDSLLRAQGKWLYIQYDVLNRQTVTGLWTNSSNRIYHEGQAAASTNYPNPGSSYEVLTETYYDNYSWVAGSSSGLSSTFINTYASNTSYFYTASNSTYPYPQNIEPYYVTRGMVTGSKTKALGTETYLFTVTFYDDRGRVIQTHSTNYSGGKDTITTQYSFSGQLLRSLLCHGKAGTNSQQYKVLTKNEYDAAGRLTKVSKKAGNSTETVLTQNAYDEIGQLMTKRLGNKRDPANQNAYLSDAIDTLDYSYNIRGWLKGINKNYARAQSEGRWFGMELAYDFGFSQTQLNGNIAGMRWRSRGDGEQRAYGFSYDAVNRITKGDFSQNNGGWNTSAGLDFTVKDMAYDANGNLLSITQKGWKLAASQVIDSLVYEYSSNTNRLHYVTDKTNNTETKLGDFKEIVNNTSQDYWYDGNGNLLGDNNKAINSISYNYLNQPTEIRMNGKGKIAYVYDAYGNKLAKTTVDSSGSSVKTTVIAYVGSFVYKNDTLQFAITEEGRIRPKRNNFSDTMYYDYFLKDHLGNVRVVLTDELRTDAYPAATMETGSATTENIFYANIEATRANRPVDMTADESYSDPNDKVAALTASGNKQMGPAILLKVMAGDKFSFRVATYNTESVEPIFNADITTVLSNTLSGQIASQSNGKYTSGDVQGSTAFGNMIAGFLADHSPSEFFINAGISWIAFDEHFNYDPASSGFAGAQFDDVVLQTNLPIRKNGYLYVYLSNVTYGPYVYFDNLQVTHIRGPLLEENHYYPFGLPIAGISAKALNFGEPENRFLYNGKEMQRNEFSDQTGLEWLDYGARMYDVQIGRWHSIDPKSEAVPHVTPFNYCFNNPVAYVDPDGMLAKYNWYKSRYEDEKGKEVSWDEVQRENGFGAYASTTSVLISQYNVNQKKDELNTDGPGGGLMDILDAARSAPGGKIQIIQATSVKDAADQIEKISGTIDNLIIASHGSTGNGTTAYFAIGNDNIHDYEIVENTNNIGSNLSRIATKLSTTSMVVILACGSGGYYNNGDNLLKVLSEKFNCPVFGPQYSMATHKNMFNSRDPKQLTPQGNILNWFKSSRKFTEMVKVIGNWTMAFNSVIAGTITVNVYNVYFDSFGKIHYTF